eukprot:6809368-Prorocentrum_lima.AAC.1
MGRGRNMGCGRASEGLFALCVQLRNRPRSLWVEYESRSGPGPGHVAGSAQTVSQHGRTVLKWQTKGVGPGISVPK